MFNMRAPQTSLADNDHLSEYAQMSPTCFQHEIKSVSDSSSYKPLTISKFSVYNYNTTYISACASACVLLVTWCARACEFIELNRNHGKPAQDDARKKNVILNCSSIRAVLVYKLPVQNVFASEHERSLICCCVYMLNLFQFNLITIEARARQIIYTTLWYQNKDKMTATLTERAVSRKLGDGASEVDACARASECARCACARTSVWETEKWMSFAVVTDLKLKCKIFSFAWVGTTRCGERLLAATCERVCVFGEQEFYTLMGLLVIWEDRETFNLMYLRMCYVCVCAQSTFSIARGKVLRFSIQRCWCGWPSIAPSEMHAKGAHTGQARPGRYRVISLLYWLNR